MEGIGGVVFPSSSPKVIYNENDGDGQGIERCLFFVVIIIIIDSEFNTIRDDGGNDYDNNINKVVIL